MNAAEPDFDLVVLGGGSGGYAAALRGAQLGLSVALVEKGKLGGTCLHVGCIPTKALLHAAEVADTVREADQFGVTAELVGVDAEAISSYRNAVVARLFKGLTGLVKGRGVELVEGYGRLTGAHQVEVDGRVLTGRAVVLATGSRPRAIPGFEPDGIRILTSDDALALDRIPASAIVLGGGVIGCEFASAWKSLGSEVTVVEALDRLVPGADAAVSAQLHRAFRRRKIASVLHVTATKVVASSTGVSLTVQDEAGVAKVLEAEVLLVAVGRGPVTDGVGLEEGGVVLDRGFVVTDDRLRTNVPGVYAVGDIVPGLQLAHRGFQQGIFVAEEIAGLAPAAIDETAIPRVTYSRPEVASVGLTEAQARERWDDKVSTVVHDLGGNGKSQILRTQGFVKLVADGDGRVVGVHIIGERAGELIGEAQVVYAAGLTGEELAPLVHAHPTQNEALGEAYLALAGKPLHAHA